MKKIYIVLTSTGSIFSKPIRYLTKFNYNHVSLSLEESCSRMYSFGRLNPNNPIIGGFIEERFDAGTFAKFKNNDCKIISIDVTDEQHSVIESELSNFISNKHEYKYGIVEVVRDFIGFGPKRNKRYYCSMFVYEVLRKAGINIENDGRLIKIETFLNINHNVIFSGDTNEFLLHTKLE